MGVATTLQDYLESRKIAYEVDRHLGIDLDFSYFITGNFLSETDNHQNMMHIAPTVSYKF